jgi:hypothetical protein
VKVTIRISTRRLEPDSHELFRPGSEPRGRWGSFLGSVAAHGLSLVLLSRIGGLLPGNDWTELPAYTVQPISVLVPERAEDLKKASLQLAAGTGARRHETLFLPPGWELPRTGSRPDIPELLLQPDVNAVTWFPEMNAHVIAWARRRAPEARSEKAPVRPGRENPTRLPTKINAPPKPDVPNREATAADLNMASGPNPEKAALPMPASTTTPMRVPMASAGASDPETASDGLRGEAANLMLLSPRISVQTQLLMVPPGSNSPGQPGASDTEPEQSKQNGGAEGVALADTQPAGRPDAIARGSVETVFSGNNTEVHAMVMQGAGAREGGALSPEAAARQQRQLAGAGAVPLRRAYDVVVVQSEVESLEPATRVMTGKPIYTVYLDVGVRKAWLFYYCVPKQAARIEVETPVVSLGKLESLAAPYPDAAAVPSHLLPHISRYGLIHGFLTAGGKFRDLRFVDEGSHESSAILDAIGKWVFHPALRDGAPVEVEVLLAIPPSA